MDIYAKKQLELSTQIDLTNLFPIPVFVPLGTTYG